MKQILTMTLITCSLFVVACAKKGGQSVSNAPVPPPSERSAAPAPSPPAAEPSQDEIARAQKLALLDYAGMEDKYMNDPHAQWAASAKASSTFGDDGGRTPSDSNAASNVVGAVDGKTWTNNHQDIGFDWLELGFAKPVTATEVRVVFHGNGVEAVSKLELQDTQGNWSTVWSGLSDVKADARGSRTWFVRRFDKTPTQVKSVKVTIANNVERGYKEVDAAQLVGE